MGVVRFVTPPNWSVWLSNCSEASIAQPLGLNMMTGFLKRSAILTQVY